jgi:hypothetical protein
VIFGISPAAFNRQLCGAPLLWDRLGRRVLVGLFRQTRGHISLTAIWPEAAIAAKKRLLGYWILDKRIIWYSNAKPMFITWVLVGFPRG